MFNKKMLDIMFITPEFAPLCTRSKKTKWSSSEKALDSMRTALKSGGLYTKEIVLATRYSQPSVAKAMKILESNNEVTSKRTAKNQPVFFELIA
tara:strand:+ start:74 stop:355 length:282 start_codon:yes stop_codon:yes gene_type:complete